jgi:hypothetical protein
MHSPFPGMDPYLESRWGDVHTSLCVGIRTALQSRLPEGLRARAEEQVILESLDGITHDRFESDAHVVEVSRFRPGAGNMSGQIAVASPILVHHVGPVQKDRWIQIVDTTRHDKVITVIEILSPGNKRSGTLNKRYRRKLHQYMRGGVNVVEIDLLRSSRQRLEIKTEELPPDKRADYMTCVHRADAQGAWEVYPMPLMLPLPTIAVPCRETDPDVPLSLQPLIAQAYADGAHDDIDYALPCNPPLNEAELQWFKEKLIVHQRR